MKQSLEQEHLDTRSGSARPVPHTAPHPLLLLHYSTAYRRVERSAFVTALGWVRVRRNQRGGVQHIYGAIPEGCCAAYIIWRYIWYSAIL